jgi:type VI secretion system secreted protein VgrG
MSISDKYVEENRFLFLETPLGPDKLLLESYSGQEGISQLFSFQLELLSEDHKIDFADLLGQKVHFGVAGPEGSTRRHIHGIVTSFAQLPSRERFARYRAVVSPSIWKLTRKQCSRIFQDMSAADIIRKVLQGYEVDYQLQSYAVREYCVQYRETDFAFISRLMEEEGMYYFFKQLEDGDKMVIGDTPSSHLDMPGESTITYDEVAGGERWETRIYNWSKTQQWDSGKCELRDYNFETPRVNLATQKEILPSVQVGRVTHKMSLAGNCPGLEVYDYPGCYKNTGDGNHLVETDMRQIEAAQFLIRGESNVFNLIPGYRFTLKRHFNADGQYLVTSVVHSAAEGAFHSTAEGAGEDHFENTFTCIPFTIPYHPPRQTPRPQVRGCQTALVVGQSGEEIYTDKYGRIKVQFHWDREGQKNESSSCWVRVATFWAGKNWGAIHIPRIGQEVVVDFLEGDPDRPLVVGSVYNADNMPPYSLPGEKTKSCVKSRSSKNGSASNFNEIRFEDLKGSEEIFVQAEKDVNILVKNDETAEIGHDLTITVKNNRTVTIKVDDSEEVDGNQKVEVKGDQDTTVRGNQTVEVDGDQKTVVVGKQDVRVDGDETTNIIGKENHTAVGGRTTNIAASDSLTVMARLSITATGGININSAGLIDVTAPVILLNTPMLQVAGAVQCSAVISPTYTPGAGNMV